MANWASVANLGDPSTEEWKTRNLKWIEPIKGQRWQVYGPAAQAFEGLLTDLAKLGYSPISSGGYNYRNIRGGDTLSQHAFGTAIDLNAMTNQLGQSATDIPHAADLAKKWGLEWGGNWKGRPDPMHFEWMGQQMAAQGYSPEQIRKAFLSTIASGESPGYDVMYGGNKFTDFSKHPGVRNTANGVTSDAAGRYQFLGSTWGEQAAKYGYKDFSPETQDLAAWNYANDIYKTKTGESLEEALKSGDAARINAAANVLNQTWTSLPGGKEQGKGYGDKTFYDIYSGNLGPLQTTGETAVADATGGAAGGTGTTAGGVSAATKAAAEKDKPNIMAEGLDEMLSGLGGAFTPAKTQGGAMIAKPMATSVQGDPTATFSSQGDMEARNRLATAMARLNQGRLWG